MRTFCLPMTLFKTTVREACLERLTEKIESIEEQLADLAAGAEGESKSSAGDKHETGRAMVQIEQARLGKQRHELVRQLQLVRSLDPTRHDRGIALGSLIQTDKGLFYVAVAAGKLVVQGREIMTVSPHSPLGEKLLSGAIGDAVSINTLVYTILASE